MKERRMFLRIKKDIDTILYIDGCEYPARIIDISKEGIAFEADASIPINEGDIIAFTLHDTNVLGEGVIFIDRLFAHVRDISATNNGYIRYGCAIRDSKYEEYVHEQLIAYICSAKKSRGGSYED